MGPGRSEIILPLTGLTDMPKGIAVNEQGDICLGFISHDRSTHGVWPIGRRGGMIQLPGSGAMPAPDALAVDSRGNSVSDAEEGSLWRFFPAGRGARWVRHPLLAPREVGIGTNGVALVSPATLYVAVTEQNHIVRIQIRPDGGPGAASVAALGDPLRIVDGLAPDAHGNLYAAIVGRTIVGTKPIVRVDPRTGAMTPLARDPDSSDWFSSLAFGRGPFDHQSLYVASSGLFPESRPDAAPAVVRLEAGVPGAPHH